MSLSMTVEKITPAKARKYLATISSRVSRSRIAAHLVGAAS